jgi:NAD(P) transhydrogenase subunit alpha
MAALKKAKLDVVVQAGLGLAAGYRDEAYAEAGAEVVADRAELLRRADALLRVRALGADAPGLDADLPSLRPGQVLIGTMDPLTAPEYAAKAAEAGVTAFALELLPRITRAQSMDVLSSQANLAGYKAVLIAAERLGKVFPMMMTAAGTIAPSKVFVIGAGVAGLQAIATARRLGAVVSAYDVRPAVKEQVESLGGRFVELEIEAEDAQAAGGYARAMGEEFYRKQAELMTRVVAENDVVITTAAIPGQRAPILVTRAMVEAMQPGSIVVDIAAERGGNCELTVAGETIEHNGVLVAGPLNLPSTVAFHASQLYAKNIVTFLLHLAKDGALQVDTADEITRETLLTQGGQVVNARVREKLGLEPLPAPEPSEKAAQ